MDNAHGWWNKPVLVVGRADEVEKPTRSVSVEEWVRKEAEAKRQAEIDQAWEEFEREERW